MARSPRPARRLRDLRAGDPGHHRPGRTDLIRTLTLISPAMPFLDPRRSAHGPMIPLLWIPRVDLLAQRRMRATEPAVLARQILELCFADPSRIAEQRMVEAVEETRLR